MEIVIKVVQFIASFSLLVLVHEFGHFIAARIFGIRVEKFYLFFDPWFSLVKFKYKGTEFGIGWIPFGGYCKISGMVDESMDTEQLKKAPEPYEYRSRPAWQRLLVISGGVIMNIVLAVCIYIGMSYTWGDRYISNKDVVEGYAFSELGQELGFVNGDKIVSVNGKEYDDFRYIQLDIITEPGANVAVLRGADTVMINISKDATPRLLESEEHLMIPRTPVVVVEVSETGTAVQAGLEPGDRPVAFNGEPMLFSDQFIAAFAQSKDQTVEMTIERDSAGVNLTKAIALYIPDSAKIGVHFGQIDYRDYIGVRSTDYTFLQSFPAGIKRTGTEISNYWKQFTMILNPKTEAYKSVGGPLRIGSLFPSEWSSEEFWRLTAFLSIVLAIFNVLPIPALDGGHIFFLLIEVITGRKPSDKTLEIAQWIGLILIFTVMFLACGNDIYRLFIK